MDGYKKALQKYKIKVNENLIVHCDFNQDYAYHATLELLNRKNKPDAIFTISDRMAIGAMLAIKEKGLNIPSEIGLVGFNNEPVTNLVTPSITSIEMPAFEIGKAAAKLFVEIMNHREGEIVEAQILKPKLLVRNSSQRII
jgi:LacI family transcriptional regulator